MLQNAHQHSRHRQKSEGDGGDVRVGTEVEEELEEGEAHDERRLAERVEVAREDSDCEHRVSALYPAMSAELAKGCLRKSAAKRKPWIWIHLRPSFSIVRMDA